MSSMHPELVFSSSCTLTRCPYPILTPSSPRSYPPYSYSSSLSPKVDSNPHQPTLHLDLTQAQLEPDHPTPSSHTLLHAPSRLFNGYAPSPNALNRVSFDQAIRIGGMMGVSRPHRGNDMMNDERAIEHSARFLSIYGNRPSDRTPGPPAGSMNSMDGSLISFLPRGGHTASDNQHFRANIIREYGKFSSLVMMPEGGLKPEFLVVCLHGFGCDYHSLTDLAVVFQSYHALPVTWIFPQGNICVDNPDHDMIGRAWFDLGEKGSILEFAAKYSAMMTSKDIFPSTTDLVDALKQMLKAWSMTPDKLALIGFSQGAIVAADLFMSFHSMVPIRFLGILSGAPIGLRRWKEDIENLENGSRSGIKRLKALRKTKIIISHGHRDFIVPRRINRPLRKFFNENLRADCVMLDHDEGHSIPNWIMLELCSILRDSIQSHIERPISSATKKAWIELNVISSCLSAYRNFQVNVTYGGHSMTRSAPLLTGLAPFLVENIPASVSPVVLMIKTLDLGSGGTQRKLRFKRSSERHFCVHLHLPDDLIREFISVKIEQKGMTMKVPKVFSTQASVMDTQECETIGNLGIELTIRSALPPRSLSKVKVAKAPGFLSACGARALR